jgi:hypothetical protein
VVGANFAQIAVIVLGILYHQGRVSFNFCGIFRKMGSSCWRKAEDELLDNMKDSGDVEGEFKFFCLFFPNVSNNCSNFYTMNKNTMFLTKTTIYCGYNPQCVASIVRVL